MIKVTADKITMTLPFAAVNEARKLAKESAEKYSALVAQNKAPYHQNTVHSHFIGKVGEIGAAAAFQGIRSLARADVEIDEVFRDSNRDRECDLIINGMRIEVKTWKPYALDLYGTCVSDRQAVKLHKKCDAVVYASFNEKTHEFQLVGWNTIEDIQNQPACLTGPVDRPEKQVKNRVMTPRMITELPLFTHGKDDAEETKENE